MATAPKISNLPAAPNRQQPANFSAKGDALLSSLQGFATEANALGDYVEEKAGQVSIDKAAVDANVPLLNAAKAAAPQALAYRDTTKGYKDSAAASEAKALQHKNDLASTVVYQNLASIAVSKNINMVDGCIDTSTKPSLSVQQQTEWYWEPLGTATRGLRRDMPQTLVVIVDTGMLYLFDGDDPSLPLWKSIGNGTNGGGSFIQDGYAQASRCVSSEHGVVAIGLYQTSTQSDLGKYGGVVVFDFGADTSTKYRGNYHLSRKGRVKGIKVDGFKIMDTSDVFYLEDGRVHSIKVATLDNAPINPISGVPEVTVFVGGLRGYHQLGWDGVKSDQRWVRKSTIGSSFEDISHVDFSDGWVMVSADVGYNAPTAVGFFRPLTQSETGYSQVSNSNDAYTHTSIPRTVVSTSPILFASAFKDRAALGYAEGLKILHRDPTDRDKTGITHVTSKFNTGVQHGDNVMTIACDSVAEVLTQVDNIWSDTGFSRDDGVFTDNGDGSYTSNGGTGFLGFLTGVAGIQVGQVYEATYTIDAASQGRIRTPYDGAGVNIQTQNQVGTFTNYFTAAGTGLYIYSEAFEGTISNIQVKKAFADRVHPQKGISFTGQVTKEKVAVGADKVWFTGLTNNNRMIQAYNTDLDVGFGDFSVYGWFKHDPAGFHGIIQRSAIKTGTGDPGFCIYASSTHIYAKLANETNLSMLKEERPVLITLTRIDGIVYLYGDDILWDMGRGFAADMTVPDSVVSLGGYWQSGGLISRAPAKYADWRFSRTGMTQEHVSRMFREEAPLFRPNAKAVLNGTRDSVNFGDWDKKTGLLTVGNSSGRTVLSGIKPVRTVNDPITSKIITHNGLVLEQ